MNEIEMDLEDTTFNITSNELDDLVSELLDIFYLDMNIDEFIEKNKSKISLELISLFLGTVEHIAIDYGNIKMAFYFIDEIKYLVKRANKEKVYFGHLYMSKVNILNEYGRYKEALDNIEKALNYFEIDSYEIAEALSVKGDILKDIQIIKESNRIFHKLRKKENIHCDSFIGNYKALALIYQGEGNYYLASKYFNLAMNIADKSEIFIDLKLDLLLSYSDLKISEGLYDDALRYLYYVYLISNKFEYYRIMFDSLFSLSNVFLIIGDFKEAKKHIELALEVNDKFDREIEYAYCYKVLGVIESNLWKKNLKKEYCKKAIVSFNKALKILKESEERELYGEVLFEIGVIYKENDNLQKAIDYFNHSLDVVKTSNNKSNVYSEFALLYASIDKYDKAFYYLHKIDMLSDNSMQKDRMEFYITKSQVYFMQGSLNKALNSAFKAIEIYEDISQKMHDRKMVYFGDKTDIFIFFISIACKLKKYKIAFEILEKAKSKYFLETLYKRQINSFNSSLEYENLVSKIEKSDNIEEIFKLRKKLKNISYVKDIEIRHISFDRVKKFL